MNANDVSNLLFSPQWTSTIIHYFISGGYEMNRSELKFELIYLALPIILDDYSLDKLARANRSTTLASILASIEFRNRLIGLNERIEAYRKITNEAIVYLGNRIDLQIGSVIKISDILHYQKEKNIGIKPYAKAAFNLGSIITKEDYKNVFIKLEIIAI